VPTAPSSQALLRREGLHRQLVVLPDAAVLAQEEEDPGGPGDLVGQRDTADTTQWRTEIGWPVFQTGAGTRPGGT
jgi:hypothetical protein